MQAKDDGFPKWLLNTTLIPIQESLANHVQGCWQAAQTEWQQWAFDVGVKVGFGVYFFTVPWRDGVKSKAGVVAIARPLAMVAATSNMAHE